MKLEAGPFNLEVTLCCGQVFRWNKKCDWWYGVVGGQAFKVRQTGAELEFCSVEEKLIVHYFSLDDDLQKISDSICKDQHIRKALSDFWGLRLVRQEPWECLISYICATNKNITAIRHMIQLLSQKFGEKIVFDSSKFYAFPTPKKLAYASAKSLLECGLGYRAKYVKSASKRIFEKDFELESLGKLPYEKAKMQLCSLVGVGPKVADCVLLFSLGKTEAFPVDRWIERVISNHYIQKIPPELAEKLAQKKALTNSDYSELNAFGRCYFGLYAGYAQEYLYHYERMKR